MTRRPASIRPRDLDGLRARGLSDRDVLDAVEVISYFNYINRVADALGVDPEPEMQAALARWGAHSKKSGAANRRISRRKKRPF